MLANLATSLVLYEKIKTTISKAKEVKSLVDQYIHLGKKADLTVRRQLLGLLPDKKAVAKILEVLGPRYSGVQGGVVQIYKLGPRVGDGALMCLVRLKPIENKEIEKEKKDKLLGVAKTDKKEKNESAKKNKKS